MIHGIAMGGGLGVSVNGKYRILSESVMIAMPETGIGFFPDVGGTTFLSQAPGKMGLYLALTGARLKASDSLYAGLGTHHIPHAEWEKFKRDLQKTEDLEGLLKNYEKKLAPSELAQEQKRIDDHFGRDSVEAILKSLEKDASLFGERTYETLKSKSPLSLKIAFEQIIKHDKSSPFFETMKREFRISQHLMHSHDFYEGVRAVLVDKDQSPHWSPSTLEGATSEMVSSYFASLGEKELTPHI
ncbi:Enoyl-CoA hydratase/isomerase family protein [Candidatus Bealeia paramacronuclearis]|uniref:3-hydroxyisobutyryl-CoA hydrolase n=1 Tax=Candidatus Bealeia paramacronuclearis TaxID=1921001 RepID=A0ABZ2C2C5_9PROT|nr:Enoyl-CoA hydratase/isomerase family protein [Candidatus Bealeia paramacronuclearis]